MWDERGGGNSAFYIKKTSATYWFIVLFVQSIDAEGMPRFDCQFIFYNVP